MGRKQAQQVVKQAGQTKCYVWTLNNYTDEEIFEISTSVFNTTKKIEYICFGKEIGDSGTPHLQGYLELAKKGTYSAEWVGSGTSKTYLGVSQVRFLSQLFFSFFYFFFVFFSF